MNASAASLDNSIKGRTERALNGCANAEQLVLEIAAICGKDANSAWEVLALVDQYYRRGRISNDIYRTVKFQIQRMALGHPVATPPPPATMTPAMPVTQATPAPAVTAPATVTHAAPRAGLVLRDRYVLEQPIDYGNSDAVYQALDRFRADLPEGEQRVAVRFPKLPAEAHREFFRAQALTHANIVRVLECDREGELAWYTLELLPGKLLRDLLAELPATPLPMSQALAIVREVGAALVYAHEHNVVHGAFDSASVMITNEGKVRVLNFGSVASEGLQPEPRDDLNALACLAYELLAGKHPFQGHSLTVARQLGLRAKRPTQLNRRQWRALQQGLALSRKKKMLLLKDWLPRLELQRAVPTLPPLAELLANTPRRPWGGASITLIAIALGALAVAMLALVDPTDFREHATGLRQGMQSLFTHTPHRTATPVSAVPPEPADQVATPELPVAVAAAPLRPSPARLSPPAADRAAEAADAAAAETAPEGEPLAVDERPGHIGFLTDRFVVPQEAAAARVLVGRSSGQRGDIGFSWWTENGSASAGADFMSPGVKHEVIPDGQDSISVFVPLVSAPRAPGTADFYVVLGDPTGGASLGRISRLRVVVERH